VRDAELLAAWSGGDAAAGNRLVERHFASVFRFVRASIDTGVDDLVQQIFLALVESAARLREPEYFKSFLFGIARRQMLLYWRAQRRRDAVIDPDVHSVASLVGAEGSASGVLGRFDERERVLVAMRTLPIDFQIVIQLHYWEAMGVREIAEVIEAPVGTVKSRLARARSMLAQRLGDGVEAALEISAVDVGP
jgi:RNA polymerase sigma-70 factor (ECF subfamily)